jgi:hypothetical protein
MREHVDQVGIARSILLIAAGVLDQIGQAFLARPRLQGAQHFAAHVGGLVDEQLAQQPGPLGFLAVIVRGIFR